MDKLNDKLEKIDNRLNNIDQHLAVYNEQLKHHIKRSDQADHALSMLDSRIKPIETHVGAINLIAKAIAVGAALVGLISYFK